MLNCKKAHLIVAEVFLNTNFVFVFLAQHFWMGGLDLDGVRQFVWALGWVLITFIDIRSTFACKV